MVGATKEQPGHRFVWQAAEPAVPSSLAGPLVAVHNPHTSRPGPHILLATSSAS